MIDEETTARRKAMAEAIRATDEEMLSRPKWPGRDRYLELATVADMAAQQISSTNKKGNAE